MASTLRGVKAAVALFNEAHGHPFTAEEDYRINRYLERCKAADVDKFAGGRKPRRGSLTKPIADRLAALAKSKGKSDLWLAILLLSALGLRTFQLAELAPADVDLDNHLMTVLKKCTRRQRGSSSHSDYETLPVPSKEGLDLLKRVIQEHRKGGGGEHTPVVVWKSSELNEFIKDGLVELGVKVKGPIVYDGAHCFRHGRAVDLAKEGIANAKALQGWKTDATVWGYSALGREPLLDQDAEGLPEQD